MSIEKYLKDLATAAEAATTALLAFSNAAPKAEASVAKADATTTTTRKSTASSGKATNKAPDAKKVQVEEAPKHSREEMMGLLKKVFSDINKPAAQACFTEFGYSRMADIKDEHIDAVCENAVSALSQADEPEDEDEI